METKEKNSLLIELCKIQMDHFEKTRNIEFKVNIALWTLIALAVPARILVATFAKINPYRFSPQNACFPN